MNFYLIRVSAVDIGIILKSGNVEHTVANALAAHASAIFLSLDRMEEVAIRNSGRNRSDVAKIAPIVLS